MTSANYSSEAVEDAACMLAFVPGGEGEVLHEAAFALGRALPVLYVVPVDEDVHRFDPQPTHVIEIELDGPDAMSGSREAITTKLASIAERRADNRPAARLGRAGRPGPTTAGTVTATTVDQGEALLQTFLADRLSERLIERLLLEAGCRASWVEFRLQQQFGGW